MENELAQYVTEGDTPDDFDYKPATLVWWKKVLADPEKLIYWLCRLHNTEKEAEARFIEFAEEYCTPGSKEDKIFRVIAEQERTHGVLIEDVLKARGVTIDPDAEYSARYWAHTGPCIVDRETAAAVGYFAEDLSLQRMQVIIELDETPDDLRQMFIPIHHDEGYHTRILAKMAGEHGITQVVDCHTEGLKELGLKLSQSE